MATENAELVQRPLEVTPVPVMSDDEIERTWRVAKALAASNFYKDARQAEAAFAKILLGRDLGLSATESMQALHVFDGKVEASGDFHATRVKRTPGYDYKIGAHDERQCAITFYGPDVNGETTELGVSTFTIEDAQRAKLDGKDVWKKYPRNMLFNRAMSNGVAWYCPEVMGAVRVYTQGEVEEITDAIEQPSREEEDERLNAVATQFPVEVCRSILEVVDKAREVGHAGLSDIGTLEMRLLGQDTQTAEDWIDEAQDELARVGAYEPPEAEVVPSEDTPEGAEARAEQLRVEANALLDEAEGLRESATGPDDPASSTEMFEVADGLEAEAAAKHEEAERLVPSEPGEQETLGGEL